MAILRYLITIDDRIPASVATVYSRGGVVNGAQDNVNVVTVHAGHDIVAGHKFLYSLDRTNISVGRVFTCTVATTTQITFSGAAATFTDKNHLVPLSADTGAILQADGTFSQINWDGSTVVLFKDPNGDTTYTAATVPVAPGGEIGFWSNTSDVWVITRSSGGRPLRIYILAGFGSTASSGGGALPEYTVATLPPASASYKNQLAVVKYVAGPAVAMVCLELTAGTFEWVTFASASS